MIKKKQKDWTDVPLVERPRKVLTKEEFESLSADEKKYVEDKYKYNKITSKVKRFISKTWKIILIVILVLGAVSILFDIIVSNLDEETQDKVYSYTSNEDKPTQDFYTLLNEAGIEYDESNTSEDYLTGLEAEYESVTLNSINYTYDICNVNEDTLLENLKNSDFGDAQEYLQKSTTGCNLLDSQELLAETYNEIGSVAYIKEAAEAEDWNKAIEQINNLISPDLKVIMTLFMPTYVQRELWGENVITFDDIDNVEVRAAGTETVQTDYPYVYYFEIITDTDDYKVTVASNGVDSVMSNEYM